MKSKFTQAFDSLQASDYEKFLRAQCVISSMNAGEQQKISTGGTHVKKLFKSKRGIALLTATAVFVSITALATSEAFRFFGGLQNISYLIKDTFIDMDNVAAFAVWNPPETESSHGSLDSISYVHPRFNAPLRSDTSSETPSNETDSSLPEGWDEELYDWESDYDWDPTKANVLISINEDGKVNEVVYERTNDRGQVRQDVLGNAAAVYVSNNFTYVMYVNDTEWEFWKEINFAQEMRTFNGFHCHHERMQTIVIHNETGKVFALKDLFPQIDEKSGAKNYTMQVDPFREDFLHVKPMYGNDLPLWYHVIYDETNEKIRYEDMLPNDPTLLETFNYGYNVRAARVDKYGQKYLYVGKNELSSYDSLITAGIVNLPTYTRYDDTILFEVKNGIMFGTDKRVYVFDEGKLKVFGENFTLAPVEVDTDIAFEGLADDFDFNPSSISYKLQDGYLYSMFGEVWKVENDGTLREYGQLEGSFPCYADNAHLVNGEIIAFVDTEQTMGGRYSINGRMVHITFDSANGTPHATITHLINASEMDMYNRRMVVEQNENPYSSTRGDTKYFSITVQNGVPKVTYFANGYNGGVLGLVNPITEPLIAS